MSPNSVSERAKDALGVLAIAYGTYSNVMFSLTTLKKGVASGNKKDSEGKSIPNSTIDSIQSLFLTGFYNGIKKSNAVQKHALPQEEAISIEQELELQVGKELEKKLMEAIKNKKSFVDKYKQDVSDSIRKVGKTDIKEAILKEDIFGANILSKVAKKRFANQKNVGTTLAKLAESIEKGGSDAVAFLLGNAMWLGELAGSGVAYTIDLCPEVTQNLKIGVEKLLELEIYNKYFVKQLMEQLYTALSDIYKLSINAVMAPVDILNVTLGGIYDGLNEGDLSQNIKELEYRNNAIKEFLKILNDKPALELEGFLNQKEKEIDKKIEAIEGKIELAENAEYYMQQLKEELKKGEGLENECKTIIEKINSSSPLIFSNPPSEEYKKGIEDLFKKLAPHTKKLELEKLDNIIKGLKEGKDLEDNEDVLRKIEKYFKKQQENYNQKNKICNKKIEEIKRIQQMDEKGKEEYINSLEEQYDKLQVEKDVFKKNISVVLTPLSLRPWGGISHNDTTKKVYESAQVVSEEQKSSAEALQDSIKKNLLMEQEIMGKELHQATQSQQKSKQQTTEQKEGHHTNLDKLTEELGTKETWLQYGKRIVDQHIKDYEFAKRNYLESKQRGDKKVKEKGLSTVITGNPMKHKAQYELTTRGLISEDERSKLALSYMDNIRASINVTYLVIASDVYSISKNTAKYISDKVNNLFSSQQLVQGK